MKPILMVILVMAFLAACGGGGDAGLPGPAASSAQRAAMRDSSAALSEQDVLLVNSTTAGQQALRTIGATSDGGYVAAWISGETLYLQRYDSAGVRLGGETPIALVIEAGSQPALSAAIDSTRLAVLGDGSVVVIYRVARTIVLPNGTPALSMGLYFQRFDGSGTQVAAETQVSPELQLTGSRSPFIGDLTIAPLADGGFVVGWTVASFSAQFGANSTLSVQRYDSRGQPVGNRLDLGQFPALSFGITPDAVGGYTVVARYADSSFNPLVSVVHFNADQSVTQIVSAAPGAVALLLPLPDRYLLFVSGPGGSYQQVLDLNGQPVGEQTARAAGMPVAAAELGDATYVLIVPDNGAFTAQRFDAGGNPLGRTFTIPTGGAAPQIVALADGGFALAWSGPGAGGDADVFTQRFSAVHDSRRKACLQRAGDLKGPQRKAFVLACLAS